MSFTGPEVITDLADMKLSLLLLSHCLLTHKPGLCLVYVLVVSEDGVNRGEEVYCQGKSSEQ